MDAGPNIDYALMALGIGVNEIDGIFHTHCHDDHPAGLTTLIRGAQAHHLLCNADGARIRNEEAVERNANSGKRIRQAVRRARPGHGCVERHRRTGGQADTFTASGRDDDFLFQRMWEAAIVVMRILQISCRWRFCAI